MRSPCREVARSRGHLMPSSTHRQRKLAASTAQDQAGSLGAGGGAGVLAGAGAVAGSVSEVTVKEVMEMTEYFLLARLSAGVTALHMVTTHPSSAPPPLLLWLRCVEARRQHK